MEKSIESEIYLLPVKEIVSLDRERRKPEFFQGSDYSPNYKLLIKELYGRIIENKFMQVHS